MENIINNFRNEQKELSDFRKDLKNNNLYFSNFDIRWAFGGTCDCEQCSMIVELYETFKNRNSYIEEDE